MQTAYQILNKSFLIRIGQIQTTSPKGFSEKLFLTKVLSKWAVPKALNLKKILLTGLLIKYIKFADLICISLVHLHFKFMQPLYVSLRHICCEIFKMFCWISLLGGDSLYDQSRVNRWHPFLALHGRQWSNWNCWYREVLKLYRVSSDGEFVTYYIRKLIHDWSCLPIYFSWKFLFYNKLLWELFLPLTAVPLFINIFNLMLNIFWMV